MERDHCTSENRGTAPCRIGGRIARSSGGSLACTASAVACACLVLAGLLPVSMAVAKGPDEYEVKAAFLYNFALYVDWPDKASSGDGSFVIGILGDDPFGDALDAIAGEKSVRGRRIEVLRFRSLDEYRDCDILFVSSAQSPSAERLLQIAGSGGALIVGEERGFARHGGMINFFIEDSRVRFEINPDAASAAGLSISSKLLRLASIVGADGREG